eukprot:1138866-Pelagomonas_calceolata.AAC.5
MSAPRRLCKGGMCPSELGAANQVLSSVRHWNIQHTAYSNCMPLHTAYSKLCAVLSMRRAMCSAGFRQMCEW